MYDSLHVTLTFKISRLDTKPLSHYGRFFFFTGAPCVFLYRFWVFSKIWLPWLFLHHSISSPVFQQEPKTKHLIKVTQFSSVTELTLLFSTTSFSAPPISRNLEKKMQTKLTYNVRQLIQKQHTINLPMYHTHTLPALLSGTSLQTLSDLVTPLKGHSLSPGICPPTQSAPSKRFGY